MTAARVRTAFLHQAIACETLGSSFTARLCRLAGERLGRAGAVGTRILGWPGDPSAVGDSVPLRFAGALHALVLAKRSDALAALYPPADAEVSDDAFWELVEEVLRIEEAFILHQIGRAHV